MRNMGFPKELAYFLWDSRLEMMSDEKGRSERKPRAVPPKRRYPAMKRSEVKYGISQLLATPCLLQSGRPS